jgi:methyl-accepting chemotaxis protein
MRPAIVLSFSAKLLLCFAIVTALSAGPMLWLLSKAPLLAPGSYAAACLALGCQLSTALALAYWLRGEFDRPLRAAGQLAACMACGDLSTHEAPGPHAGGPSDALLARLQATNDRLAGMVSGVRAGTETIACRAGQVASGSLELAAQAAQHQAALGAAAIHLHAARTALGDPEASARHASALLATVAGKTAMARSAITSATDATASVAAAAVTLRALPGMDHQAKDTLEAALGQISAAATALERAGMGITELAASAQRAARITRGLEDAVPAQLAAITAASDCIAGIARRSHDSTAMLSRVTAAAGAMRDESQGLSVATAAFVVGQHHGHAGWPLRLVGGAVIALRPLASSGQRCSRGLQALTCSGTSVEDDW